ncbi:MAG: nicotinate-nucleotide--dimethylbenzimidazole phosphoribosyltransferase [Deferribacterales bacterium]
MLNDILVKIEKPSAEFLQKGKDRNAQLLMPPRAMGRLHEIAEQLCSIYSTDKPVVERSAVFVMAGDHGVVEEGVSPFPQKVTTLMFNSFLNDLATVSVLAKKENVNVILVDVGSKFTQTDFNKPIKNIFISKKVLFGTKNFTKERAMSVDEAIKTIEVGFEVADHFIKKEKLDIIITGEMGIGNTTPSAAIGAVVTGNDLELMTGKGAGLDDEGLRIKIEAIKKGLELHNPDPKDPIDILSKVGGAEIGAIAGLILAAAYNKKPVIIDGFISTAGALLAYLLNPITRDYMIAGHCSEEPGHIKMLDFLALKPILNLNLRLGEGTGAVLALSIIKQAANMFNNVGTFADIGL